MRRVKTMPNKRQPVKVTTEDPIILNAKILKAEKASLLTGILIGLLSGPIIYFTAPFLPMICVLVIGIGSVAIASTLFFHFHFGKDLPKRTISPEEYGSHLKFRKSSSSGSSGAQAYNRANGNPSSNFFLPSKYL